MKKNIGLFIGVLFISLTVKSQTFLLLDRRWYKPAVVADSVTRQNLSDGWYPIYKSDLDSLLQFVDKLKDLTKDGLNRKYYHSDDFKTANIEFQIENIKRVYGDGYEINLKSNGPFGTVTIKLSEPRLLLPDNQKTIRNFLAYLKQTQKDIDKPDKKKKKNSKNNPLD